MQGLRAESISKTFPTPNGELTVLHNANLSVESGTSVALMGPSGSGKSTLLNILGTLDTPSSGSVSIDGIDPFSLDENEMSIFRNKRIGFIFQDHHLLPQCDVLENVLLPTLAYRNAEPSESVQRAERLISRVGLSGRLHHRPAELSGGERQRVAIARALINQPTVVLADEPTGNLDRTTADGVADLLLEIPADDGAVLIVVTHSSRLASRFTRLFDLADGVVTPH